MDPKLEFLCYLGAGIAFVVALLGGTRRGRGTDPVSLVALGLLLILAPTLWKSWQAAF